MNSMMDLDPLSYESQQFENYSVQNPYYAPVAPPYSYKDQTYPQTYQPTIPDATTNNQNTDQKIPENESHDVKPDVSRSRRYKLRGKTSNFWNKKISDKDFAFYGCSVCNIAYTNLQELDQHVTIHTNRMTSYDLRLQNLKKRKNLKKMKKKQKKSKIKQEVDVEIKPEDGYIGTEKASDFVKDEKDGVKITGGAGAENNENKPENNVNVNNQNTVNVYKCFGCDKKFALSYYLKIHVRSHTDEKPYTCSVCGQSFITASKLGRHNKRIHLSVRHQCRICFKFFSRLELLVKHFDKMHEEDKIDNEPYDYNTILPYLKELEEQQMREKDNKPKEEDPWSQYLPVDNADSYLEASVTEKESKNKEMRDKSEIEVPSIKDETKVLPTTVLVEEQKIDCDIKVEIEDKTRDIDSQDDERFDDDPVGSDDDGFKEENDSGSDEEYFPSDTWVKSPSPPSQPVDDKTTTCQVCHKKLSTKSYLRVHMRTHTGEKPFTCYVCKRGFITASKMHRHVLTHDETWEGKDAIKQELDIKSENEGDNEDCKKKKKTKGKKASKKSKCKLLKKTKNTLENSFKQKYYRKRPFNCEYCNQRFLHTETLQVHRKCHEGETLVLQCHYCLEPVEDEASLKDHESTHTGPKPFMCNICGNVYKKRETMVYHRKTHKSTDEKTFICDICSKKFNSQAKLQRHITSHSIAKFTLRYECPVCAHMFHTRYHIQMHLSTHMKEGLILEENRSAVLAMVLQNARKIPKATDGVITQENMQADERSRICNICGQIFQHFYYLEEHLKTHGSKIAIEDIEKEEEKKYTCQVCSKSFKLHYYLKLHSYTHTKEKPFICQQCGKGFITKGKLKRHLETHQGLKKYQCHICYKFFTRPSYLRIHVRTIHGTQDYNFRDFGIGMLLGAAADS